MRQTGTGVIPLPFTRTLDSDRHSFDGLPGLYKELRDMQEVMEKNNRGLFRTLRSAQNHFEAAIDEEGMPRKQLEAKHFEKDSIYGASLERGVKNFITDVMVMVEPTAPNPTVHWSQNGIGPPYQNSILYWPDNQDTTLLASGSAIIIVGNTYYFYVDPRQDLYDIVASSLITQDIKTAQADGRICLWRVQSSSGRSTGWRHVGWGGGRDLK